MKRIYLHCNYDDAGLSFRICLFNEVSELGQDAIRNRHSIALFYCWFCFLSE
ncbi:MAG: hypothetical protein RI962_1358 [Pseudomonadota bacterium]|jgi:hypothetical protein